MEKCQKHGEVDVVFMGEKPLGHRCLKYLSSIEQVKIVAICTRKKEMVWWGEQHVRQYAKENDIQILKRRDILDIENVDLVISVLYPYIIEDDIIGKASIAAINLHQAPLPEYKGCNSASHAIINGEKRFGGTLHLMTKELDSGSIIEKRMFDIDDSITAKELYEQNDMNCFNIFKDNIRNILANEFSRTPQDKLIKSHLYGRDSLKEKRIELDWPFERIWKFVRGNEFSPFESAFIESNGRRIYLTTKYGDCK